MRNKLAMSALVLWLITVGALGILFMRGNRAPQIANDVRIVVELQPAEREFILSEMRELLRAVHEIHAALATGETQAAIKAARRVGMGNHDTVVENAQPGLMLKIPMAMKKLGHDTHRNFDVIADLLDKKASATEIHRELVELTAKCVSCHSGYRLNR
ncbi:MAG: hypothetical protein OHK0011_03250 [Turneriella sp.]